MILSDMVVGSLLATLPRRVRALWIATFAVSIVAAMSELLVAAAIFRLVRALQPASLLLACGAVLARNLLMAAAATLQARAVAQSIAAGYTRLAGGLLTMPYQRHARIGSARLLQNAFTDLDSAYRELLPAFNGLIRESLVAICLASVLLWLAPGTASIVVITGAVALFAIGRWLSRAARDAGRDTHAAQTEMVRELLDISGGMRDIRAAQQEPSFLRGARDSANRMAKALARSMTLQALPRVINETLLVLGAVALFVLTRHRDLALISVFVYGGFRLAPSANRIHWALHEVRKRQHGASSYLALLQEAGDATTPVRPQRTFTFESSIALRDVSFAYDDAARPALVDVTMTIRKGECIALAGSNGSGKSTLLDLLAGVIRHDSGTLLIDGRTIDEWRAFGPPLIAYVPQLPYLRDAPLEANIAFARELDPRAIRHAAQLAHIDNLLGVGDTIGDRGARLSGGQRQRTALARALALDAEVLLLDEPASALDPEMEGHLLELIDQLRGRKTIVLATQDVAAARCCDRVIVLERGSIVADGPPDRLQRDSESFRRWAAATTIVA